MSFFNRTNKKSNKNNNNDNRPDNTQPDPSTYVYNDPRNSLEDEMLDPASYVYRPEDESDAEELQSYTLKDLIRESGRQEKVGETNFERSGDTGLNSDDAKYASDDAEADLTGDYDQGSTSGDGADVKDPSLEERYEENFEVERKILLRNIKRVAAMVLAMFIGLMSYLVYFQVAKAGDLRADSGNRRNAEARNKVLRGSIADRNGKVLSLSTLHNDGTQTREYPGGVAFGNILGYVSDKYSITGLELSMDKSLSKGTTLASFFSLDFLTSLLNPEEAVTKKQEGNSLKLTLDADLQNYAYDQLAGRKGSVVALDPKTGEILAMVSSPGFSAARLDEVMKRVNDDKAFAAKAPLINRTINSVFAPGSTMKVVTVSSALDNLPGVANRIFDDKGVIQFPDGTTIKNFNGNVYGKLNLQQAFTNSSNYIFGNLGMELTNAQFKKSAEAFGFNREITMEGMTARKSIFPNLGENEAGNKALSAIGQGEVAATPLQMAMVAAAVANNGQLAQPSIISQISDKDKNIVSSLGAPRYSQALSADTARQVAKLMAQNVQLGGSAYQSLQQINGAGKTGTGQFETATGTNVNAWFVGFAPVKDPTIAIAVCVEDLADVNENTGAQQAIPLARSIMARWLNR